MASSNANSYGVGYVAKNLKLGTQVIKQPDGSWSLPMPIPGGVGSPVPASVTAAAAKRVNELKAAADTAGNLASDSRAAISLNHRTGSGGIFGAPIIGEPMVKIASIFDAPLKEMDAKALKMAKNLRAPGQRLTQAEWARNLTGVVSPQNSLPANEGIDKAFNNDNAIAQAQAAFNDTWFSKKKSLEGVEPAWQTFRAQHFDAEGNYHPNGDAQAPAPASADGWKYLGPEK